jgi:hypothetical protein
VRRSDLKAKAVQAIDRRGALLVYPVNNRKEPLSLWSELYPRSKMRWEWDEEGDSRVSDLWHLREQLSRSRQVVYAKWFQGRATFFSLEIFTALVSALGSKVWLENDASPASREVMDVLLADSPLSTKQLKAAIGLEGRLLEPEYNRALKPLWSRLALVGFGEFEDSSFPSLGIGATATLFEDLWRDGGRMPRAEAWSLLESRLGNENPFIKFARRVTHRP